MWTEVLLQLKNRDGKLNYWGYTRGYYFAPKCAYSSGPVREPEREFKDMVKALHRAGLELVLNYSLTEGSALLCAGCGPLLAQEYHVDGVRLVGYAPVKLLGEDPYLSRLKLFAPDWEGVDPGACRHCQV